MWNLLSFFKRDEVIAIAAGVLGFFADYALNLSLSHTLAVHEFGDFRVAWAFAIFCGALVLLGGDRAAPRVLADPLDQGKFSAAWEYLRFYGLLGLLISSVIIAVVWIGCYFYHQTWDPNTFHAVAIMALTIPFMAAGSLAGRTLQTVGRTLLAAMPWRVGAPLLLLAALMLGQLTTVQVELNQVLWLAWLIIVVVTLAQWAMVRRYALKVVAFAVEARKPRAWLHISAPMVGVFLVTLGLSQSDLYFLEWLGDERSVGHYAAAITTAHFILPIQTSIVALYAPLVTREIKSGSARANTAFFQGQRTMMLALAPVVLGLVLGAGPIMGLFGADYQDAALVLRLLAFGNGVWAFSALSALWLQYCDRGMTVMRITLFTLLVDSLLNALLIPEFGMLGAAASSAATSVCAAILIVWLARRPQNKAERGLSSRRMFGH